MTTMIPHSNPDVAQVNGIELAYDTFGEQNARPLLLIQGLSWQMIMWDDDFCTRLAERGYRVIRFDNRDIGRSSMLDYAGIPNIGKLMNALAKGEIVEVPYLLTDMADDALGLLDTLGISSAHIVGISMGGMIGQTIAIRHPERIRTLTSMMSSTGAPGLPPPTPEAFKVISVTPPSDREDFIKSFLVTWRVLNRTRFPVDEDRVLKWAALTFDRGFSTPGVARQIAAISASGSRRDALTSITIPTLVIHGDADPLVPVECGIDTADAVPGAKLMIIEGMGHALAPAVWDEVVDAIADHAR